MMDWSQIQELIESQGVSKKQEELLKKYFISMNFEERQTMMKIFLAYPEKCEFFIELLEDKVAIAQGGGIDMSKNVCKKEKNFFNSLLVD